MTTKHTPGTWTTEEYCDGTLVSANRKTVAMCPERYDRPLAETSANAVLISAAPDLPAALKRLMPLADREDVADTWGDEFDAAEAAIAKAEGISQ